MSLRPQVVDFDKTWKKLTLTINDVITSTPVLKSTWNERFMDVYALCVAYPEPLAEELYSAVKSFLESHVRELLPKIQDSENLFESYFRHWTEFRRGAQYLDLLFRYLNQQHARNNKMTADLDYDFSLEIREPILEVGELALDTWHNVLIDEVGEKLVDKVLDMIDMDRAHQTVNRTIIYGVIESFVSVKEYKRKQPLKLYEDLFERKYLERSEVFYRRKAAEFIKNEDCSVYMKKVLQLLSEEEMRSANFLHKSSYPKVTRSCRQRMVTDYLQFLHSNAKEMIREEKKTDLQHLYAILKHAPETLIPVCSELQRNIEETGLTMLRQTKDDSNPSSAFIDCILTVHGNYGRLIKECFQDDKVFTDSLRKACRTVVNFREKKAPCRSPELLAKYCDGLLRKSVKGLTENDIDEKLKSSIIVFKHIEDKDLFLKFYSRNLAKRLIHGLCNSMYNEEAMINRLKEVCGYDFTSKLHRMFNDIRLSTDLNAKFSEHLGSKKDTLHINFNVNVLQAGAWPLGSTQTLLYLPQDLTKSVNTFKEYYAAKFPGRKLSWLHHLAQAEVKVQLTPKTYFVTMSTYQLAVLLLFNDSPQQALSYIAQSTNLDGKELERTLSLLVDAKLLDKEESSSENPTYTVNSSFSNKRTRFKIATALQKESIQEVQNTHTSVAEDRKLYLQAAIVRIMKARKMLKHNDLIQEIISMSQPRFLPSISVIKKSIESLIEKSYLERSADAPDKYQYLA